MLRMAVQEFEINYQLQQISGTATFLQQKGLLNLNNRDKENKLMQRVWSLSDKLDPFMGFNVNI